MSLRSDSSVLNAARTADTPTLNNADQSEEHAAYITYGSRPWNGYESLALFLLELEKIVDCKGGL